MSLLPPNSTAMERALDQLAAARIGGLNFDLRDLWDPLTCPESLLPWLAWALSVDQWSPDWPLHIRRARVASAIKVARRKGTAQSVKDVVASFGGTVVLKEWWKAKPPGPPHTFSLTMALSGNGDSPSADFVDAVVAEVRRTKPVRSHFTFTIGLNAGGGIGLRGAARLITAVRL